MIEIQPDDPNGLPWAGVVYPAVIPPWRGLKNIQKGVVASPFVGLDPSAVCNALLGISDTTTLVLVARCPELLPYPVTT